MSRWTDVINMSLDICVTGIIYTFIGILISYLFHSIFDEFNEEWINKSDVYKIIDVTIELISIPLISFWVIHFFRSLPLLFPVSKSTKLEIELHLIDVVFMFALFIFLEDFTDKLQYMHEKYFGAHYAALLPQHGSLANLTLSYSKPIAVSGAAPLPF